MAYRYEEYQRLGRVAGWTILIAFTTSIILWGLAVHFLTVMDERRWWDFGVLPDAPGESIYSSLKAPPGLEAPQQFPQLPGSVSLDEFRSTHIPPDNVPYGYRP